MIRQATEADIPLIMEIGRKFADEAGIIEQVGWDDESALNLIHTLIDGHILLVGDRAIFGAVIFPHPFNNKVLVLQEMFWRSEKKGGRALLAEAERIAKERGATRALMIGLESMPSVETLYGGLGYKPAERTFIKEL